MLGCSWSEGGKSVRQRSTSELGGNGCLLLRLRGIVGSEMCLFGSRVGGARLRSRIAGRWVGVG